MVWKGLKASKIVMTKRNSKKNKKNFKFKNILEKLIVFFYYYTKKVWIKV